MGFMGVKNSTKGKEQDDFVTLACCGALLIGYSTVQYSTVQYSSNNVR